jgi:hypothetical protein
MIQKEKAGKPAAIGRRTAVVERGRNAVMSCYFRYMKDILEEAGITVDKQNKKDIDKVIHSLVNVDYKDCSPTWKKVKERIKSDASERAAFIAELKQYLSSV